MVAVCYSINVLQEHDPEEVYIRDVFLYTLGYASRESLGNFTPPPFIDAQIRRCSCRFRLFCVFYERSFLGTSLEGTKEALFYAHGTTTHRNPQRSFAKAVANTVLFLIPFFAI